MSAENDLLEICWKPLREDPTNFDAWTHLLQCVEQMDETKPAREAYDEFLKRYPYCYGYWKKYADMERRHKRNERAIEVYERGVAAIALSVDLWLSYLVFYKEYVQESEVRLRRIRYLYERAVSACGLEFRSDKLWEDYISWERENDNLQEALSIYDRLIKVPTLLYANNFDKLQEFVNSQLPDQILSENEFGTYYKEIDVEMRTKGVEVYVVEEVGTNENGEGDNENGGSEHPNGGDGDNPKRTEYRKKYNDEALKLFRVSILDKRRKSHLYNEQEVSKRWNYEEAIKRPYFHVKPLERSQLKNWRAYLDFEITEGVHERIVTLFERCLIACALYEDIWIRFGRYMEKVEFESARKVYTRACSIHLSKKPNPHLAWSAFEEKNGYYDEAKQVLHDFEKVVPGLIIVAERRCGIERRQAYAEALKEGAEESAEYESVTARFERLLRDSKLPTRIHNFYAIKFARFNFLVRNDARLAEKILVDALARDKSSRVLHEQLIDIAMRSGRDESGVVEAFDRAIYSENVTDANKLKFSQQKLEYLEEVSQDITKLQEHFEYHQKLYKSVSSKENKRKATADGLPNYEDKRMRHNKVADAGAVAVATGHATAGYAPAPQVPVAPQVAAHPAAAYYGTYQQGGVAHGYAGVPPAAGPPIAGHHVGPAGYSTQYGYYTGQQQY